MGAKDLLSILGKEGSFDSELVVSTQSLLCCSCSCFWIHFRVCLLRGFSLTVDLLRVQLWSHKDSFCLSSYSSGGITVTEIGILKMSDLETI